VAHRTSIVGTIFDRGRFVGTIFDRGLENFGKLLARMRLGYAGVLYSIINYIHDVKLSCFCTVYVWWRGRWRISSFGRRRVFRRTGDLVILGLLQLPEDGYLTSVNLVNLGLLQLPEDGYLTSVNLVPTRRRLTRSERVAGVLLRCWHTLLLLLV
jgi:hypothetical protein